VLLAPPLNYGMSLHHMGFPGSLSLRPQTLTSIVIDLAESAYLHGFRHILLLNGHGGNTAAIQVALAETLHELHGLEIHLGIWWREPQVRAVLDAAFPGEASGHADAGETSMVMAIRPDVLRLERAAHNPEAPRPAFLTRQVFLEHFPHGVIGLDPRRASAELGERVLAAAVAAYEDMLEEWGDGR
jgi:creatinine amidohydrolase